jgi:hypothetical protein
MSHKTVPNRALHIVDVENEIGGRDFGLADARHLRNVWNATVPCGETDQYVVATGKSTLGEVAFGWPGAVHRARSGADGADMEIVNYLEDIDYIASRFTEVYVGTGDHYMQEVVGKLIEAGVHVTLVARKKENVHHTFWTTPGLDMMFLEDSWDLAA